MSTSRGGSESGSATAPRGRVWRHRRQQNVPRVGWTRDVCRERVRVGSALVPIALGFAVLELTGSASDPGLVLVASRLPRVLLVLAVGVVGDRLPRRGVMLVSDLARCATQATTAVLLATGTAQLWRLLVLQAAHGAAAAFFDPAATGLVPQTVSPGRLQQANALVGHHRRQ